MLAIIQARMRSKRFKGKVLKEISGKPLLWHVVNRVRHSKIDDLVVATTINPEDDPIVRFAEEYHIKTFRGSEEDVLDRFYQAAKKVKNIVRVCGDNPLIDPETIDTVINLYDGYDYFSNRSYPEGLHVEVFSFEVLEQAWKEAKSFEREHVTPFIYHHDERFKIGGIVANLPPMRLCVDYPCDLELVREVYKKLWQGDIFNTGDICHLFEVHPELLEINKGIPRLEGYHESQRNHHLL